MKKLFLAALLVGSSPAFAEFSLKGNSETLALGQCRIVSQTTLSGDEHGCSSGPAYQCVVNFYDGGRISQGNSISCTSIDAACASAMSVCR